MFISFTALKRPNNVENFFVESNDRVTHDKKKIYMKKKTATNKRNNNGKTIYNWKQNKTCIGLVYCMIYMGDISKKQIEWNVSTTIPDGFTTQTERPYAETGKKSSIITCAFWLRINSFFVFLSWLLCMSIPLLYSPHYVFSVYALLLFLFSLFISFILCFVLFLV